MRNEKLKGRQGIGELMKIKVPAKMLHNLAPKQS